MAKKGVIYFLTYEKKSRCKRPEEVLETYYKWCVRSANGIRKHMSDLEIRLYTDLEKGSIEESHFDTVVYRENSDDLWTFKYDSLLDSPYDITLHLDADSLILEEFNDAYTLLDRFDIAMPLNPWYWVLRPKDVPLSFPTFAGGFMLWKKNRKTDWFLERTRELVIKRKRRGDEPCIRKALYESKVRYTVLPWEYSCCYMLPGLLIGKAKIIQGRGENIEKDAEILNTRGQDPRCLFTGESQIRLRSTRGRMIEIEEIVPYGYNPNIKS